jgi:UDPglucose 6-dehydrogenase|tara:strand:+ start:86 stop:919 length:834 start_codon:yes stop_codon:yes gene_type:complete
MDKSYNIGIVGLGYVGKAVFNGFSSENIFTYDIVEECSEKSLEDLARKSEIIFVCLPTPMNKNGSCSTKIIDQLLIDIQSFNLRTNIVIKSTVPPGTCDNYQKKFKDLNIIFNPEFLTEANFYDDFINQKRIILGGKNSDSVERLYQKCFPKTEIVKLNYKEAEMVKYFSNSFLALKVSYANEIYSLCKKLNIDYTRMISVAAKDDRIGNSHLKVPGPDGKRGFGGSCFPKDVAALLTIFKEHNINSFVLNSAWERNIKVDRSEQDWKTLKGRATVD